MELISYDQGQLSITKDLPQALRHLRRQKFSRTLWIDQICINQINLDERSAQVTIMGEIYRHANRVVVWLGPAKDDSDLAMHLPSQVRPKWPNWLRVNGYGKL